MSTSMHVCPVILHYTLMCHIPNKKSLVSAEVSKNFPFLTSTHIILLWLLKRRWKNLIFWMDRTRKSVIIFIFHIKCRWSKKFGPAPSSKHEIVHISTKVSTTKGVLYTSPRKFHSASNCAILCHYHYIVLYLMSPFKTLVA